MSAPNDIDEPDLLKRLISGDEQAFTFIYKIYWPVLYSHALRMLHDEEEAKDVVQELFLNFHAKSTGLSGQTKLSAYLYVSLRNRILNLIRQQRVKFDYLGNLALFTQHNDNPILDNIHEKELQKSINAEIDRLPPKMRRIFELSRKEYLTHKEIASRLEISDKTVKTQINNALKSLRLKIDAFIFVKIWIIFSVFLD